MTQGRHLVRKVVGSFWGVTGTMFGCRLWIDKDRSLVCAIGFSGEAGGVATGAVVTRLTMAGEKSGSLTASFSKAVSTFPAVVTGGSLVAIDAEGKKILVMALTSEALVPQAVDLSFLVGVEGGAVSMLSPAKLASGFGLGVGGRSVLVRLGEGGELKVVLEVEGEAVLSDHLVLEADKSVTGVITHREGATPEIELKVVGSGGAAQYHCRQFLDQVLAALGWFIHLSLDLLPHPQRGGCIWCRW